MAESSSSKSELDDLLAAGDLHAAAVALQAQGDLSRARELFERVGDLSSAVDVARLQGDRLSELRLLLRLDQPARIQDLLGELANAEPAVREKAAEICERERAWSVAASLRMALQDTDAALRLYERGHDYLGIARLEEQRGHVRAALVAYRRFLEQRDPSRSARVDGKMLGDQLLAQRHCARLLLRVGRVEEAIPHLQAARRLLQGSQAETLRRERADVDADLIESFLAIDEPELAERLLAQQLRAQDGARTATSAVAYLRQRAHAVGKTHTETEADARILGRYRIGRLLGSGSVGRVYEAEDLYSGHRVALKLLVLAGASSARARTLYERFCREAAVLAALRHPKLVQIESFHPTAGVLALEYMAGGAVSDTPLPLPLSKLRRLLLDVLDALQAMHAASVLHRDIKPHNLFFDALGGTKLGDFGIASLKDLGVTQTEGLVGTLAYMAPEQVRGSTLTVATDVYGLGVTAYQLATGTLPFPGPDFLTQHLDAAPPDARRVRPALPEPWAQLFSRMLHKDPHARGPRLDILRAEIAGLPVPVLVGEQAPAASAAATEESEESPVRVLDVSTASAPRERSPEGPCFARTEYSQVWAITDAVAARTVLRERVSAHALQTDRGVEHVAWLRRMAALAGPGLQRIFSIEPSTRDTVTDEASSTTPHHAADAPRSLDVVYQYIDPSACVSLADLTPAERAQLDRVLLRLRHAGVVHGHVAGSLARQMGHITLLLVARGPLRPGGLAEDSIPQRSAD